MKVIETKINRFDGGISDDPLEVAPNKFQIAKHFIIGLKKLFPYRSVETETNSNQIGNFCYTSQNQLWGLGKVGGGNNYPKILYKSGSSLITDAWQTRRDGTQGATYYELFIEFNGKVYLIASNKLVSVLAASPYTIDEFVSGVTVSNPPSAQGLVHPKMNKLFIPCGNYIDTVNSAGTLTANQAPSISANLSIVSMVEYGNYIAIGCKDITGGNSKLLIWDGVSTTTFIDNIDLGKEELGVLNNLEGYIIAISRTPSTIFIGDVAKITIQFWNGGKPSLIKEIEVRKTGSSSCYITLYPRVNFINYNKLWFAAKFVIGTTIEHIGFWSVGRKNANYPFVVNFERFATTANNETAIWAAIMRGDYMWSVCNTDGGDESTAGITRTDDKMNFLATSVYISQKFNGEIHGFDGSWKKNLKGVSVQHGKLPSGAWVKMYYRVDGATSWTSIFKNETDNTLSYEAVLADTDLDGTSDTNLQRHYREIEFKIEYYGSNVSSGDYSFNGFSFKEDIVGRDKYT